MGSNPLRPNPSVILPPEILDKVLENALVNRSDKRTLFTCALVATWWTGPSQRRLFSSVAISEGNYNRWMNGVVLSESKVRLSEYVQSLVHHGFLRDDYRTLGLPQDSGEYLSALRNLRSLTLTEIRVQYFSEEEFRTGFSAFRESLTYLFLDNFSTSFSAFVALVGYFPNITTLRLDLFEMEPDEGPVPSLSRPLRGKLQFIDIHNPDLEFYGRFSNLDLEYEELVIGCSSRCPAMEILERALRISPSTVKFLTLPAGTTFFTPATINGFRQLQELEVVWPSFPMEPPLIPSITSTKLRKIIFLKVYLFHPKDFTLQIQGWASIDEQLCGQADWLRAARCRHTLEVELRLRKIKGDPRKYDFTVFLPEFREKGVVTIIDMTDSDRVLHCSTHNR